MNKLSILLNTKKFTLTPEISVYLLIGGILLLFMMDLEDLKKFKKKH